MYVDVEKPRFSDGAAEYDRISGDQLAPPGTGPNLKAYQYCLSTLDKSDGLPREPADKMSGNEQDRLTDERRSLHHG